MKTTTKSRRPRLRVVGGEPVVKPSRTGMSVNGMPFIFELWTYERWWATPEWDRPTHVYRLPGVGVGILRSPVDDDEMDLVREETDAAEGELARWLERSMQATPVLR